MSQQTFQSQQQMSSAEKLISKMVFIIQELNDGKT
jgi:hypothetical protein